MRAFLSVGVLLALAGGAAGCHRDRCVSVCEQREKELGCHPKEDCKTSCRKLHTAPTCRNELKRFEDCFLTKPVDKWECDHTGLPVTKADECLIERHLVMGCLEMGPQPPATPAKKP